MATQNYHNLKDVCPGRFDWNIKVRIIRQWRGVSKSGEEFKGYNLLLLDNQKTRLHAFVPSLVADKNDKIIKLGQVHTIYNFTVKEYKSDEKFRVVRSEHQILFTTYTQVEALSEVNLMIPKNMFDFYDLSDLGDIANDNTSLTDVIGVIYKDVPLRRLTNKHGITQSQVKLDITDGRCTKSVTFWDGFAHEFQSKFKTLNDYPAILIVSSAKISSWQGSKEDIFIDISNANPSAFYLNYDHHNVIQLRRLLKTTHFSKYDFSSQIPYNPPTVLVEGMKLLDSEYLKKEVICELKIIEVLQTSQWFECVCTSCFKEIEPFEGKLNCKRCLRVVPYPDKKFHFLVEAMDETDSVCLQLYDMSVQNIIGKDVFELEEQGEVNGKLPGILKSLENKYFNVKVFINAENLLKNGGIYSVTDMYPMEQPADFLTPHKTTTNHPEEMTEDSTSKYHLSGLSQLNFDTPDTTKPKRLRKQKDRS